MVQKEILDLCLERYYDRMIEGIQNNMRIPSVKGKPEAGRVNWSRSIKTDQRRKKCSKCIGTYRISNKKYRISSLRSRYSRRIFYVLNRNDF